MFRSKDSVPPALLSAIEPSTGVRYVLSHLAGGFDKQPASSEYQESTL